MPRQNRPLPFPTHPTRPRPSGHRHYHPHTLRPHLPAPLCAIPPRPTPTSRHPPAPVLIACDLDRSLSLNRPRISAPHSARRLLAMRGCLIPVRRDRLWRPNRRTGSRIILLRPKVTQRSGMVSSTFRRWTTSVWQMARSLRLLRSRACGRRINVLLPTMAQHRDCVQPPSPTCIDLSKRRRLRARTTTKAKKLLLRVLSAS